MARENQGQKKSLWSDRYHGEGDEKSRVMVRGSDLSKMGPGNKLKKWS
jgi:hypothetical protein